MDPRSGASGRAVTDPGATNDEPADSGPVELARGPAVLAPVRRHLSRARRHRRGGARVRRTATPRRTLCQRAPRLHGRRTRLRHRAQFRGRRATLSRARVTRREAAFHHGRETPDRAARIRDARGTARGSVADLSRTRTRVSAAADRLASATPRRRTHHVVRVLRRRRGRIQRHRRQTASPDRRMAARRVRARPQPAAVARVAVAHPGGVVSGRRHDRDVQRRRRRSPRAGRGRIRNAKNRPTTAQASHARRRVRADAPHEIRTASLRGHSRRRSGRRRYRKATRRSRHVSYALRHRADATEPHGGHAVSSATAAGRQYRLAAPLHRIPVLGALVRRCMRGAARRRAAISRAEHAAGPARTGCRRVRTDRRLGHSGRSRHGVFARRSTGAQACVVLPARARARSRRVQRRTHLASIDRLSSRHDVHRSIQRSRSCRCHYS